MKLRRCDDQYYADLYDTAVLVLPAQTSHLDGISVEYSLRRAAGTIKRHMNTYQRVLAQTGVSMYFVGLLHWMECGCDFERQILNGERWASRTTRHPVGYGPFASWFDAAQVALYKLTQRALLWDVPTTLRELEKWNGYGYRRADVHSPYLWGLTNHGMGVGKFEKDGQYNALAKTKQVGAGIVLKALLEDQ